MAIGAELERQFAGMKRTGEAMGEVMARLVEMLVDYYSAQWVFGSNNRQRKPKWLLLLLLFCFQPEKCE